MLKLSDTHHFRKVLAGCAMVLAPAVLLVGTILHPAGCGRRWDENDAPE